jgi:predicted nucleic acid-binding protein
VLATAIDGEAAVIVSEDDDLRVDELRAAMESHGIRVLGVQSFLNYLEGS